MQNLSNRLKQIAVLVPKNSRVADIGTDHGYLPIYLIENGIASYCYACDIAEKPLKSAERNIENSGLHNIEFRLSDGLEKLHPNELDSAVIAGMGGEVISGIIDSCTWIKDPAYTLILQPTTSPEKLRLFLANNGFYIETETAICENNKIYSIMVAKYCGQPIEINPYELYVGKLKPNNADNIAYIKKQLNRVNTLATDLKNVPNKQAEYIYYSKISESLIKILGGTNGT